MPDNNLLESIQWKNLQNKNPKTKEFMGLLTGFVPGVSDVQSGLLAAQDIKNQKYAQALLDSVGMLPMIPALGGTLGKFKYDAISHELPLVKSGKETSPFIGYITKNGEHELFDAKKAKAADYHHSYLVKNMDNYDSDSTLRFVRMGGENRFTLTGDSALNPYHPQSTKQIQMLSKKLQENGADPNANFLISDMALPFNEAPYQNKEIGKLSDWWSK